MLSESLQSKTTDVCKLFGKNSLIKCFCIQYVETIRFEMVLLCGSSQAPSGTQQFLLLLFIFAQNKVKVGRGGHGIEDVCFVRYEQLSFW